MRNGLIVLLTIVTMVAQSATTPRGNERLRELAVVPTLPMTFDFSWQSKTLLEDLTEEGTREDWIEQTRKKLKSEPNNLEAQLKLGRLLTVNNDTNAAKAVYEKAAALGRQRLEHQPNDGINLTLLAEAVGSLGKTNEAEALCRRASLVASNDWHGWVGLGETFLGQAFQNLGLIPDQEHESMQVGKPATLATSSEKLDAAIKQCHEASIYFQRAYEIAPREFEVLVRCGQYRSYSNWQATLIQQYRMDPKTALEGPARNILGCFFSPVARQDYERALAVRPQAYKLVSLLAFSEWFSASIETQQSNNSRPPTLEELPEKSRQVIVGYMQRLKELSDGPDKKVAAGALIALCMVKMQFGGLPEFSSELQRAVEYDPTNEQAWNMLIGVAANKATPEKLTELCERRLKGKESARNHLILAKALYLQKRFKEADEQAKAALKLNSKYLPAAIMQVALAIRQGKNLAEMADMLETARQALAELTDAEEGRQRARELALNIAVIYGVEGKTAEARQILDQLSRHDAEDEQAREIRNALP